MITTKQEFTVTCKYCDYKLLTPNESYAKQQDERHLDECRIMQAAKRVAKNMGEQECFLAGYEFCLQQTRRL